jgi:hypothetical protein
MFRILSNPRRACDGLTRRELLVAGGLGALGVANAATPRRAKSVICLFLFGGWSQYETFDPKPDAAAEIRGPYKPIATPVPGLRVCEHLPRMAKRMDRVALVRSVTSDDANHNTSLILTGHHATVGGTAVKGINPGIPRDWPFFMSALEHFRERGPRTLPGHVCVPNRLGLLEGYHRTGPYGGFLGAQYDPVCTRFGKNGEMLFQPGGVSAETLTFAPGGLDAEPDVTLDRLDRRASLLSQFEARLHSVDAQRHDESRSRALDLLTSARFRRALDVRAEPPRLRERYGWNLFGQSVLLARRLVEAGVPLVTAMWDCTRESNDIATLSWDTHWDHFKACEGWLLPGLDQALSALLDDLGARGLLDDTLVVCLSEMGRTPKVNGRAGRDHWVGTYPALFAGAGIKPGAVYGRSDRIGANVAEDPVSPRDLLATVYHLCGVDESAQISDRQRRPVSLYDDGRPIRAILR